MHATVHIADRGVRSLPAWRRAAPKVKTTAGLEYSLVATPAPLGTGIPRPQFGRLAVISFWADADAAASGLEGSALDYDGLRIDLEAVRAIGSWPGLPTSLPRDPEDIHQGPAAVITVGRLRLLQARRFFAASARAETQIVASPGFSWGTGLAAPERRTVMTVSWWHDQVAMAESSRGPGAHQDAMAQQSDKDFHHESAFIRFKPVAVRGALSGRNSTPDLALS